MLEVFNITKMYPGTLALDNVSVSFLPGRVTALLGKNGAGKSTLVRVLAGTIRPDVGRIVLDGRELRLNTPEDAFESGIVTVHQELSLVPGLSVAENIYLNRLPRRGGLINWSRTYAMAEAALAGLGIAIDVRRKAAELTVGQQQIVEIAKAMSHNPSVLMLDEPTSALARHETTLLFELVRRLKETGVIVVYISHRLQELREIADSAIVLRDGCVAGAVEMSDAAPAAIAQMMFGDIKRTGTPPPHQPDADCVMKVEGLSRGDAFSDIGFELRKGEILGISGMMGSGRTEILRAIFGADTYDSGKVLLDGRPVARGRPHRAARHGMALVPENRKEEGLVLRHSNRANLTMACMTKLTKGGFVRASTERRHIQPLIEKLAIKLASTETAVSSLSGGNQQKVVVGKWLANNPRVILMDEPTRGIDVEAKRQLFEIIWQLSREGISFVVVSSELEELVEISHRILVLRRGQVTAEVRPSEVTAERLAVLCMED